MTFDINIMTLTLILAIDLICLREGWPMTLPDKPRTKRKTQSKIYIRRLLHKARPHCSNHYMTAKMCKTRSKYKHCTTAVSTLGAVVRFYCFTFGLSCEWRSSCRSVVKITTLKTHRIPCGNICDTSSILSRGQVCTLLRHYHSAKSVLRHSSTEWDKSLREECLIDTCGV